MMGYNYNSWSFDLIVVVIQESSFGIIVKKKKKKKKKYWVNQRCWEYNYFNQLENGMLKCNDKQKQKLKKRWTDFLFVWCEFIDF